MILVSYAPKPYSNSNFHPPILYIIPQNPSLSIHAFTLGRSGEPRKQAPRASTPRLESSVLVKGFNLSYHNKETMFFAIDPYY